MTRPRPTTARAAQAAETRNAILQSAIAIMEERGFTGARVGDIATRAGVSHGLVLYHFESREQLLAAALRQSEEQWLARVRARVSSVDDPRARLRLLLELSYEGSDHVDLPSSWLLWLDMWQQALRNEGIRQDAEYLDRQWRDVLADTVRDGQDRGLFAPVDPDQFARMLSAMQDGFSVAIALHDSTLTSESALRLCLRLCSRELTIAGNSPVFG